MFKQRILSAAMALTMVATVIPSASALSIPNDEEANSPYEEVTIYEGAQLLTADDSIVETPDGETGTLVGAVSKKVYVVPEYNDNGDMVASHLLTNAEARDSSFVGEDETDLEGLTLTIQVFSKEQQEYTIYGTARWDEGATTDVSGRDYLAITWGGNQAFVQRYKSCGGDYFDNSMVSTSRKISDSYAGYCWQFYEGKYNASTGGNTMIDILQGNVRIERVSDWKDAVTSAKVTYVHTFTAVEPSVGFSFGSDGFAASIELSNSKDTWQIEVDVPDLKY